jgi:hypothetical protein
MQQLVAHRGDVCLRKYSGDSPEPHSGQGGYASGAEQVAEKVRMKRESGEGRVGRG